MKKFANPLCASCSFTLSVKIVLMIMPVLYVLVNGDCQKPVDIENMHLDNDSDDQTFAEGTELIYKCNHGYASTSGPGKSVCQTGVWSHPELVCKPVSCNSPPPIEHGKPVGTLYTFGETVTFECHTGYVLWSSNGLRLHESPELICDARGNWNGDIPKCLPIICPELEDVPHSQKDITDRGYNGKVIYVCDSGFVHSSGNLERYCQMNATWSGTTPICKDANCDDPETDDFIQSHLNVKHCTVLRGLEPGSKADCECVNPPGRVTITCQENGVWDPPCESKETTSAPSSPPTSSTLSITRSITITDDTTHGKTETKPTDKPTDGDTSTGTGPCFVIDRYTWLCILLWMFSVFPCVMFNST